MKNERTTIPEYRKNYIHSKEKLESLLDSISSLRREELRAPFMLQPGFYYLMLLSHELHKLSVPGSCCWGNVGPTALHKHEFFLVHGSRGHLNKEKKKANIRINHF